METELKLRVVPSDLRRLKRRLQRWGRPQRQELRNEYFDTADRLLARHRIALRLRHVLPLGDPGSRGAAGAVPAVLQTLKTRGHDDHALSVRGEWEMAAPNGELDLAAFHDTPLAALLALHPGAELKPVLQTDFVRETWLVRQAGALLEVALDQGRIVAVTQDSEHQVHLPILELEIEVLQGPPVAAVKFAATLVRASKGARPDLALWPDAESKAQRGERLRDGKPLPVPQAEGKGFAARVNSAASAAATLRAVVRHGTSLLLAQRHVLVETVDDVDGVWIAGVHQARVALRRIRSAARLLRSYQRLPAPLDDELRWIARAFGRVRDADVLINDTLPALLPSGTRRVAALMVTAREHRARARAALLGALRRPRFAALLLALMLWAESSSDSDAGRQALVGEIAAPLLRQIRRRFEQRAQGFATFGVARRHRLRLAAKRWRYAIDLLRNSLGPAKRRRASQRRDALADLQAALGELNDAAVARRALVRLGAGAMVRRVAEAELKKRLPVAEARAHAALLALTQAT